MIPAPDPHLFLHAIGKTVVGEAAFRSAKTHFLDAFDSKGKILHPVQQLELRAVEIRAANAGAFGEGKEGDSHRGCAVPLPHQEGVVHSRE